MTKHDNYNAVQDYFVSQLVTAKDAQTPICLSISGRQITGFVIAVWARETLRPDQWHTILESSPVGTTTTFRNIVRISSIDFIEELCEEKQE